MRPLSRSYSQFPEPLLGRQAAIVQLDAPETPCTAVFLQIEPGRAIVDPGAQGACSGRSHFEKWCE
eukprot:2954475-Alexandrium_andersonii.AAC.1